MIQKPTFPGFPILSDISSSIASLALATALAVSALPTPSRADDPYADYLKNLQFAQAKVLRTREAQAGRSQEYGSGALSSSQVKMLLGRSFKAGDSWDVVAYDFYNPMANMTADPGKLQMSLKQGGVFHYEVIDVKNAPTPQVVLKITQSTDFGLPPVDPKVQNLTLTMSDQMVQSTKAYQIMGHARPLIASSNGIHSSLTPIELFPLDVPEIITALRTRPKSLPELPAPLQKIALKAGYQPNLSRCVWYEQDDFFGRPVEILWQQGDPWPSYLKTSSGIAILVRRRLT